MFRLRFNATLLILLFLTLPCSGCVRDDCSFTSHSSSTASLIPEGFGVNIDVNDPRPGELKMLSAAGFRWVRTDLKWDRTEPERGRYDFAFYDRLLSALDQHGLHALLILDYTNPAYDDGAPPRTEAARHAFANWAVAAVRHFAGRGVIWEIYNEPNIAQFWPPQPNVNDYIALALAVGRAVREAAPGEKLIGPATSGIDFDFLEKCFKAGLLEYWAGVSVHPYRRTDPESAARDYCRLREMIRTYAPATAKKEIPILSSEWGYSAVWPGLDDDKQGQLLARQWLTNAANEISLSIWYDWHDDGVDPKEPEHHFGMVHNPYREGVDLVFDPKPAYLAARTLMSHFAGFHFERRESVGSNDDFVLIFRRGEELRQAAWTTESRAHQVVIPLAAGQYKSTTHTGAPGPVLIAGAHGATLTLTDAPVYLLRDSH
jgi:polysaccharide biosynthesis protein PslG